ncbi:MarR family winged helix-turn-helix transcriptional regulator [Prevotella dentasini]|uniref:MarR family winged helix-turn-helix transcriptional regulator n=1 Tax=Prevotella dentasini TaxID=589537 RepID=UPI00046840F5|nr:MarR family transcriptional regulator [Prevotella dentasini]
MAYEQLKLDNQLCFRLYTASRLINQAYEPFLRPLGITYTQYLVMMVLWEQDEQPVNDIGKRLLLGVNTISPLIKRMEKLGLLSRREGETDKRQQIVFLTPKGKELRRKAADVPRCMADGFHSCNIDVGRLVAIAPVLDDLIGKMSERA